MTAKLSLNHRANNFDLLRLIAAFSVVLSHHFALNKLPEPIFLKYQTLGGLGVEIFFSISGFLVLQSWQRDPHFFRFMERRLLRIWPGLCCSVFVCAFLIGPLVTTASMKEYFTHPATWQFLGQIFFSFQPNLPGVFNENTYANGMNGVIWTIPLEMACYVFLAALGLISFFRSKYLLLCVWLLLVVFYFFTYKIEARIDTGARPSYLLLYSLFFFSGALVAQFRMHHWVLMKRVATVLGVAFLSLFAYKSGHLLLATLILVPSTAILIGNASIPFANRFGRFGDFSFGIYIYAYPIQQIAIWQYPKASFLLSFICVAIVTLILSYCSWHYLEKVAIAYKPKKIVA